MNEGQIANDAVNTMFNIIKMEADTVSSFVRFGGHCGKEVLLFIVAKEQADPGWLQKTFQIKMPELVGIALTKENATVVQNELNKQGLGHFLMDIPATELVQLVVAEKDTPQISRICERLKINVLTENDVKAATAQETETENNQDLSVNKDKTKIEKLVALEKENRFLNETEIAPDAPPELEKYEKENAELLDDGIIVQDIKDPDFFVLQEPVHHRSVIDLPSSDVNQGETIDIKKETQGDYIFITHNNEIIIVDYLSHEKNVLLPDTINNLPVVGIGEGAFKEKNINTITLPTSIKFVAAESFTESSIKEINLGGTEYIGADAFRGCINLDRVDGPSVKSVDPRAFAECNKIRSVDFVNVHSIPRECFRNCESLTICEMPQATEIGAGAFISCSNLKAIPGNKHSFIGRNAFRNCGKLDVAEINSQCKISAGAFEGCTIKILNEKNELIQHEGRPSVREKKLSKDKIQASEKKINARDKAQLVDVTRF